MTKDTEQAVGFVAQCAVDYIATLPPAARMATQAVFEHHMATVSQALNPPPDRPGIPADPADPAGDAPDNAKL